MSISTRETVSYAALPMRTSLTFDVNYVLRQYVNTSDSSDVIFSSLIMLVMVSFSVIIALCHVDISHVILENSRRTVETLEIWSFLYGGLS